MSAGVISTIKTSRQIPGKANVFVWWFCSDYKYLIICISGCVSPCNPPCSLTCMSLDLRLSPNTNTFTPTPHQQSYPTTCNTHFTKHYFLYWSSGDIRYGQIILTTLVTHATHSQILSRTANRSHMYKRESSAIHGPDLSKLYSAIARWLRSTERLIIGWQLVFSIAQICPNSPVDQSSQNQINAAHLIKSTMFLK